MKKLKQKEKNKFILGKYRNGKSALGKIFFSQSHRPILPAPLRFSPGGRGRGQGVFSNKYMLYIHVSLLKIKIRKPGRSGLWCSG
jgi:hypothetical protein